MGKVFAELLALTCPVKVGHEMPHAPSVVKLWKSWNNNVHCLEYAMMPVRYDAYLPSPNHVVPNMTHEPLPVVLVLGRHQSKCTRQHVVV